MQNQKMTSKNIKDPPMWIHEKIKHALAKQRCRLTNEVIFSGFDDFDQMSGGLWPGDLMVIGGSPDMGKTALALNISEHIAFKENKSVIYISTDLTCNKLAIRTMCSEGRISLHNVQTGRMTSHELGRCKGALDSLAYGRLYFDYKDELDTHEICTRAIEYSEKRGKLDLVVVDYLQELCSEQNRRISVHEIEDALQNLKSLAHQLQCPVIALWQLPLSVDIRSNKLPTLSDMGPIDVIQKSVDTVVLLYRDEVFSKKDCQQPGIVDLIFPIRRDGSSGQTRIVFLNSIAKFETLA